MRHVVHSVGYEGGLAATSQADKIRMLTEPLGCPCTSSEGGKRAVAVEMGLAGNQKLSVQL